jgi:hypothetical protein
VKKLLLLLIAVAAAYGLTAYRWFSPERVNAFLDLNTELTKKGDVASACAMATDDLEFSLSQSGGTGTGAPLVGGKKEFCGLAAITARLYASGAQISESVVRDQLQVKRDPLHWATARVSYIERHHLSINGSPDQESRTEEELVLVHDSAGLRVRRWDVRETLLGH